MTDLTQTKYKFGILIRFTHNIPYQTGFENSTGNTTYEARYHSLKKSAWESLGLGQNLENQLITM